MFQFTFYKVIILVNIYQTNSMQDWFDIDLDFGVKNKTITIDLIIIIGDHSCET